MFDSRFTLLSIEAALPFRAEVCNNALLLKACNIYLFSEGRMFSEFDEMTFSRLNRNDYGFGTLEIEFVFANRVTKEAYPDFYTKCFVVKADTGKFIRTMKYKNDKYCSKVNQDGDLVIGIRYFFVNEDEINHIQECNALLVEGFIAFGKPQNVYGLMYQLQKEESGWQISSAYTYKPKYASNIKTLID